MYFLQTPVDNAGDITSLLTLIVLIVVGIALGWERLWRQNNNRKKSQKDNPGDGMMSLIRDEGKETRKVMSDGQQRIEDKLAAVCKDILDEFKRREP